MGEAIDAFLGVDCGSSSIKYQLLTMDHERRLAVGGLERIGEAHAQLRRQGNAGAAHVREVDARDHRDGVRPVGAALPRDLPPDELAAIGHRVVHGGERFRAPTPIDTAVCEAIRELSALASLHNADNPVGIEACQAALPGVPQVVVFDTLDRARNAGASRPLVEIGRPGVPVRVLVVRTDDELLLTRETLPSVRLAPPN